MFTLWLADENQLLSPITAVAWDAGIELEQSQWPTMEEALAAADKAYSLGLGLDPDDLSREWRVTWAHNPFVPLLLLFEPSHTCAGNHHTTAWWWAAIRDLNLGKAIELAMQDPGPSLRAQLFVYWNGTNIPAETWNRYDFHFPTLQQVPGFSTAVAGTQTVTSLEGFKWWVWWMTDMWRRRWGIA
jgi:hypothetical protein